MFFLSYLNKGKEVCCHSVFALWSESGILQYNCFQHCCWFFFFFQDKCELPQFPQKWLFFSYLSTKWAVLAKLNFITILSHLRQTDDGMPVYFLPLSSWERSNGAETRSPISSVVTSDRALAAFSRSLLQTVRVFNWLCTGVNEQCLCVPFPWLCCKEGNLWDTNMDAVFWLVQLFLKWVSVLSSADAHIAFLPLT